MKNSNNGRLRLAGMIAILLTLALPSQAAEKWDTISSDDDETYVAMLYYKLSATTPSDDVILAEFEPQESIFSASDDKEMNQRYDNLINQAKVFYNRVVSTARPFNLTHRLQVVTDPSSAENVGQLLGYVYNGERVVSMIGDDSFAVNYSNTDQLLNTTLPDYAREKLKKMATKMEEGKGFYLVSRLVLEPMGTKSETNDGEQVHTIQTRIIGLELATTSGNAKSEHEETIWVKNFPEYTQTATP
ncbi:MAG: hypothetical protein ACOYK8_01685 [Alphaproteobacteria bacterium]